MSDNSNTSTFIISLVGALAWLPILYKAIKQQFQKTVIKIYPYKFFEICENEYNVILNIRVGIHTKIKDAFIEKITLDIQHSNGDKRNFEWAQIIEPLTQTAINDTIMPTSRKLNAIGYNISKDTYTEPLISFTSPDFRNKYESLWEKIRIQSFHINQNKSDKKQLKLFDPYIQLVNAYKHHYTFTAGDHTAILTFVTASGQTFSKSFSFHIDETNVETLRELNLKMVLDKLENTYIREESEKFSYDDTTLDSPLPIKITLLN